MEKPWIKSYEPGVPATLTYPAESLYAMFRESARKYSDKMAVKFLLRYAAGNRLTIGGKMSYRELQESVDAFAGGLYALGVRKGDRVAIMLPNSPQFIIAFLGAMKIGAIVVNVNPTYTSPELKHQLNDSGAETLVLYNMIYDRFKAIQSETPTKRAIVTYIHEGAAFPYHMLVKRTQKKERGWQEPATGAGVYSMKAMIQEGKRAPEVEVSPDDVALFQYTGGTTGVPKAAMLSHRNIVSNVVQTNAWLPKSVAGGEVMLGAIPFFHVYGMTIAMLYGIYVGATILVVPDPRRLDFLLQIIEKESVTLFPGVPAMYIGILNHKDRDKYNLRTVKACISGSAPLPMEVQEKFGEVTGGRLVEGYGLTEAAPVTHCNPVYGKRKSGSIGVPFPDVEARIVDLDSRTDAPVGQPGELWVRGPQVMVGYWNKPEETAKTVTEDGWLMTGDIAVMDEEGYFSIVDRKKDMIIASGYNIYPRDVEEVLYKHPKVAEAVVAGIPHPYRGETVKAYVVLKPGAVATEDEIRDFCKENLAPYKVPSTIEFRAELPKTQVGKVLRRVLVDEERTKLAQTGQS